MSLPLANVQTTDTFQTWLTRTNEIITEAGNSTPFLLAVQSHIDLAANTFTQPHAAGRMFYNQASQSLTVYNDESELAQQIGQQHFLKVYNGTPSTITKGDPVYVAGAYLNCPSVAPADASDAAKVYSVGLAAHSIEASTYGYVVTHGVLDGLDTNVLPSGSTVHVAPGGGLQTTAPASPNYAHEVGTVITSSATDGSILVEPIQHYFEQLRVGNDIVADGNLTISGNFNVLGTETVTTLQNLSVEDTFIYLNSGDTVVVNSAGVTGLNDLSFKGHYNGGNTVTYYVKIDSTDELLDDTFSWSFDNFATTEAANVAITSTEQELAFGVSVQFSANSGHLVNDTWLGVASPQNVDVGVVSNRNPGYAAGGYTHLGYFYDVSDSRFKFFQSYEPEIAGSIDSAHPSFEYGTVEASSFIGNSFTGDGSSLTSLNAGQLTSGTVPIARLSGSGITLGTHTAGNYVATITNADSNVTVTGSGAETAAVSIGLNNNISISGEITAQDVNSTSDLRLKMNINPIEGALDKVLKLAGVEFDWVNNNKRSIGVVAQQVEEVLPELVHTNDSGYKSVSYGNLTALLIEAIKELKTIVDDK